MVKIKVRVYISQKSQRDRGLNPSFLLAWNDRVLTPFRCFCYLFFASNEPGLCIGRRRGSRQFMTRPGLVSRPMNTMMFADGAWEGRSWSEEEVMQGHRRRRATQRSPATPISPKGGGGTASISLSLLLHDVTDIASSSLRGLDAVALATNDIVFMGRGTKRGTKEPNC